MEQKKKLNVVDVLAVILLVLIVVYGGMRIMAKRAAAEAAPPVIPVTFQARAEGVAAEVYENCLKHLPSPLMASGALVGGQIEAVEKRDHLVLENGVWVKDPTHVDLVFTVTTTTPKTAVLTTKVGDQEIRIGRDDYILKSEYIEFHNCTVIDVVWGD